MSYIREKMSHIVISILEILVGIVLLVEHEKLSTVILICSGFFLAAFGLVYVIQYFRTDIEHAARENRLAVGMLSLSFGLFCIFKPEWFIDNAVRVSIIYGVIIFIMGILKFQNAIDMVRMKVEKWYLGIGSSFLTLLFAVVVFINPFSKEKSLIVFISIAVIVAAVVDILVMFQTKKKQEVEVVKDR